MPEVAAGSTEGFRDIRTEHPQRTSAAPERRIKMALLAGLGVCRRDLVFNETRDAFAPGIEFLVGPGRAEVNRHQRSFVFLVFLVFLALLVFFVWALPTVAPSGSLHRAGCFHHSDTRYE